MWDGVEKSVTENGLRSIEFQEFQSVRVVMGRSSQCIYRMIQGFLAHGIGPWFFIVYGMCPWCFTHSHFRLFFIFGRMGVMLQ